MNFARRKICQQPPDFLPGKHRLRSSGLGSEKISEFPDGSIALMIHGRRWQGEATDFGYGFGVCKREFCIVGPGESIVKIWRPFVFREMSKHLFRSFDLQIRPGPRALERTRITQDGDCRQLTAYATWVDLFRFRTEIVAEVRTILRAVWLIFGAELPEPVLGAIRSSRAGEIGIGDEESA